MYGLLLIVIQVNNIAEVRKLGRRSKSPRQLAKFSKPQALDTSQRNPIADAEIDPKARQFDPVWVARRLGESISNSKQTQREYAAARGLDETEISRLINYREGKRVPSRRVIKCVMQDIAASA